MKGGVLFTSQPDILSELKRIVSYAYIEDFSIRYSSVLFKIPLRSHEVFTSHCGVATIVLKVIPIDKTKYKYRDIEPEIDPASTFENEVRTHQEIIKRSIEKWSCSIVPTLLHADIYTPDQLNRTFPKIRNLFEGGDLGLIFMEQITKSREIAPNLYKKIQFYPQARRLLIMFAEIGFSHNDPHLGNILHSDNDVFTLIDFGRTTYIPEPDLSFFQRTLTSYDASKNPLLKQNILSFVYESRHPDYVPSTHPRHYQWFIRDVLATTDEIDPSVAIADESSIVFPIEESQKEFCIKTPPLYPYGGVERIPKNGLLLKEYPELNDDKDLVLLAVKQDGYALQFASDRLREDKDVLDAALEQNLNAIQFAPTLTRDKKKMLSVAKLNYTYLDYASPELWDTEFIVAAIKQNAKSIQFVPPVWRQKEWMLYCVKRDGLLLKYASPTLRKDREIVLAAVTENGNAIDFTTVRDPEIMMLATMHGYRPKVKVKRYEKLDCEDGRCGISGGKRKTRRFKKSR